MSTLPYPNPTFLFQQRFQSVRRDEVVGVLLAFFLGCFGIHHFYLGRVGLGLIYICFSWTGIPAFLGVIECFFMPARVRAYNAAQAAGIAAAMGIGIPGWIPYPGWNAPAWQANSMVNYQPAYQPAYQPGLTPTYGQGYAALRPASSLPAASGEDLVACTYCGRPNALGARYCSSCGQRSAD